MFLNNSRLGLSIPKDQARVFECPDCADRVFEPLNAVQFVYDKLSPTKMQPIPAPLYRCLGCQGFLRQQKDGTFIVIHRERTQEGDKENVI